MHHCQDFLTQFCDPPAGYRSMPLWVWNGEMSEPRITEMLEQFAAQGMGGVFVHPRPGLTIEYLSERWFQLWAFALQECKRLGLECNIYDENSYPAGFAGGLVPSRLPHAACQYLEAVVHRQAPAKVEGRLVAKYRLDAAGTAAPLPAQLPLDQALEHGPVLTLATRVASGNPWTAGFPMVDITRPEVAREFIQCTYEAYARHFQAEFGTTVTAIFCDEPLLATAGAYSGSVSVPYSQYIRAEFRREHGYDLEERAADLFVEQEGCAATRFDYHLTLHRLYTQNFLKPLHAWCTEHGVRLTGHFMEHEWPSPHMTPNCMDAQRWLHMPGVDLLAPHFDFVRPERNGHYLMTFRELASVANQLGLERRLCETHGVGGYGATFEEFKRLSDWIMVHGVNFINQHLSYQTISGARKYDHPQTFSDHSAWWGSYRLHADHVARLSVALSQGTVRNRVLLLHSTTSGWLHYNPARGEAVDDPVLTLRASEAAVIQWLVEHHVDFDLGDELLMADFGSAAGAELRIGKGAYSVVVLPEGMETWCESSLHLVETYLAGGGMLLALREPPPLVNGRPDPRPALLAQRFPTQWLRAKSLEALQDTLDKLAPPRLLDGEGRHLPPALGHQVRELENGDALHFLVNHGHSPISTTVCLRGGTLQELCTQTGQCQGAPAHPVRYRDLLTTRLILPPAGHALWLVSPDAHDPASGERNPLVNVSETATCTEISRFSAIQRVEPNVLALDFCDLTLGEHTTRGLYVTAANRQCWQAHGFEQDVWDRTIQFRHNNFAHQFREDSGFRVTYHVEIAAAAFPSDHLQTVELAVEHPELYQVQVNGQLVNFAGAGTRRWLDETILAREVGPYLRPGINDITLIAQPFHILCEIDRVYLLGEFGVAFSSPGFRMEPPQPLELGDWALQGLAHYAGGVRYRAQVQLDAPACAYVVQVPRWAGSVVKVYLNGAEAGHIAFPPYHLRVCAALEPGTHVLEVEVIGTPRNLLGPHFYPGSQTDRWIAPHAWDMHPPAPVDGAEYELAPYGLLGPVSFTAIHAD